MTPADTSEADTSEASGGEIAAEGEEASTAPTAPADRYINREMSLLRFHRRVLAHATLESPPLLERLRFLTISSTNLDEFFEVRVSGLKQQISLGIGEGGIDGRSPQETLEWVSQLAHRTVREQYQLLNDVLLPKLAAEGIHIVKRETWSATQREWIRSYFANQVLPVLTPVGLDPAHPFPPVLNKGLSFIVSLEGIDAFGRNCGTAIVQVPRPLPRLLKLPEAIGGGRDVFVLLSSVIHAHVGELFPGMSITGCYQFRLTRNSDLWVEEEEVDDLLHALKGELPQRNYGAAVRLEVATNCSESMVQFLVRQFNLGEVDVYRVNGPVNLHRLVALYDLVTRPDLKYAKFIPGVPRRLQGGPDMFEVLRQGDLLLHHPYESFGPVLDLLRQAARDPDVLAIKQTVYRIGVGSPVAEALLDAARSGKEVSVVVEIKARFDEARNIDLATRLQEAGANVAYGVVGYKTHAKMLMIVRREGKLLRRYVHLGTGNYHAGTAKAYTDVGLLSCDEGIGQDVHEVFQQLTGLGRVRTLRKLLHSPFTLHDTLTRMIRQEAENARAGKTARIVAKLNSLSERGIIEELYAASQAGVRVDLIVRGICCLRPGVPGLSENIRVRSVLGRFLEHHRVFHFHAAGAANTYCSSADWMSRNLFRRVEVGFPVEQPAVRDGLIRDVLWTYLEDNTDAWLLAADGSYARVERGDAEPMRAQDVLLSRLSGRSERETSPARARS